MFKCGKNRASFSANLGGCLLLGVRNREAADWVAG